MKQLIRAIIGIVATVIIIILVERTMDSFDFFPEATHVETTDSLTTKTDSTSSTEDPQKPKTRFNAVIKANDYVKVKEGNTIKAKKVFKKLIPVKDRDERMVNFEYSDTLYVDNDDKFKLAFGFSEPNFYDNVFMIALDGYDQVRDEHMDRFYAPQTGKNHLKIKNTLQPGKHTFRVGYFLKRDAGKTNPQFFYRDFKVVIL